ncbi:MAG: UDP-glucose/GDP-mannose dehydrogenase family protein [Devosia sp.]
MKVTVFGIGYVGLVQAATLAEVGHEVVCVDIDAPKIAALSAGKVAIFEPELEPMVQRNLAEGRLHFTTDAAAGVAHGAIQFIAVRTPQGADGGADLSAVEAVADSIAAHLRGGEIVVIKSTVPVGTADAISARMHAVLTAAGNSETTFSIVSNPEFLKEGSAVDDSMRPDRIIIGTADERAEQQLRRLYGPFNRNHEKIVVMDRRSAELTKYAANAMLATRISFMNEIAAIADALGADVEQVRRGLGSDPRIGSHFLYPGIGYGGSCFPKDMAALIHTAHAAGVAPVLLTAVAERNIAAGEALLQKIRARFGADLNGKTFALWGLSFKPNTNDIREAPARALLDALWARGARVQAFDPAAMDEIAALYGARSDLVLAPTKEAALEGADALIIATEWKAFQSVDLASIGRRLKQPVVFDGRNIYDPALAAEAGLDYFGIGRGARS